ncbi:MAG: DUF58 domain-containing protein [Halothiobacillaceae bacterium]
MNLRLRFEPLAWPFLGLLVVLVIGSAQYASNLGFFFSFWLAAIAALGLLATRRRLRRLEARPLHVDSGFEGEPLRLVLELRGEHGSVVEAAFQEGSTGAAIVAPEGTRLILHLPSRRRGRHLLPPLRLIMRDPLGLVRLERDQPLERHYWIYPTPDGDRPLPPPAGQEARGGQDDFSGLRAYHPGDSPARIHWRALARGGGLQTKQFGGESRSHGPRVLDEERLGDLPREARLRQLSAWVMACEESGQPYALRLGHGPVLPRGLGAEHRTHALRLLAEAPSA